MREATLAMDAGGTSVKLALMDETCVPVEGTEREFRFAGDSREALLQTFRDALGEAARMARAHELRVRRAGAACPGPFDFRLGVSHMTHKWPGLLGVPLPPVLRAAFPEARLSFLHDSTAFLLGEKYRGAGRDARNPSGVMLGTGFGYARMRDGRVLLDDTLSPVVRLWKEPFEGGTAEDAVSRRAIRTRYWRALMGDAPMPDAAPDVREIALLAEGGDARASEVFAETGRLLGRVLAQYLPPECDLVVVGGQIARAAGLFLPLAREGLRVPAVPALHIADAALYGVCWYCARDPNETTEVEML